MSTRENASDFYITLPSNTSAGSFPDNTASDYMSKLTRRIELNGEWEVALHSISYVKWNTIKLDGESIHYTINGTRKSGFPLKGYYTTIKEYVADINASIPEGDRGNVKFTTQSEKVTIYIRSGCEVHLRREQAIILGFLTFNDSDIVKKVTTTESGNHKANLHRETNIHVYCDIVHSQIVGNQTVPLLDIVRDEGEDGRETTYFTKNLHYVPVRIKSFGEVKVLLRSSTNERISFEHGHTSITLHFRQKSYF
jgi:hypothetical protein